MSTPKTYTDKHETGCCAVLNVSKWDEKEITLSSQHFLRMHTRSFLYVPLNMAKVMTTLHNAAEKASAKITAGSSTALLQLTHVNPQKHQ